MKNANKHPEELKSVHKRLHKEHGPQIRAPMDALQALVRATMSFDVSDARAEEAMVHISREFVDLNELRVATELEIQELLGVRYPAIEKRVAMFTLALNHIFEKEHTLSLDRLKTVSRRDARQFLRDLPEMHPFVEAYVMIHAFDGHAFPIDDQIVEFLREAEVLDETVTLEDAQKFVEHHLKADECFDLFIAVRKSISDDGGSKKKKGK
jgi:endonuclease III